MGRLTTLKPRIAPAPKLIAGVPKPSQGKYDYWWQQQRRMHLRRNPLCIMCAANGLTTLATVVDHIIPHRGNQALFKDPNNWQSLCAHCHSSEKQRQENENGYHV